jgi:uracil-DNA glycosylase
MQTVFLSEPDDFDAWRDAARALFVAGVRPEAVVWQVGQTTDLFASAAPLPEPTGTLTVPKSFVDLARTALCHSDPERCALLYKLLWESRRRRALLADHADPLVRRVEELAKAVRRDIHKMRAFVRFREIEDHYIAWFEPDHHIVRINASFFVRRFASMRWSILTPELSIHWDGKALHEARGARREDAPDGDPTEELWKSYYASIFNPARVKVNAMTSEMPKKYWRNLPEAALIPNLIAFAHAREMTMVTQSHRQDLLKAQHDKA